MEGRTQTWCNVACHTDTAMATGTHERQDAPILTRQLDKIGTTGDAGFNGANKISGRVLHANDAWQLSQTRHRIHVHVNDTTPRNVIKNDWNVASIMNRLEVFKHAFLARLVIVGRHDQCCVSAHFLCCLGQGNRLNGVVRPRARHDRHAPTRDLNARLDRRFVFIMANGRALTGGSHRNHTVRPFIDLPIDEILVRFKVQQTISGHRGH